MYTLIVGLQDLSFLGLFIAGCVWGSWEVIVLSIAAFFLIPFFNELIYDLSAKVFFSETRHRRQSAEKYERIANSPNTLPIIYDPRYNVTACGIEKHHPFDSVKYGRVFETLQSELFQSKHLIEVKPDGKVDRSIMLNLGVSPLYLLSLNYSFYISKCVEIPVFFLPASFLRWRVLDPMMYATQGSIDAASLSLYKGWSINLSGGYHHACRHGGGGFCVYPDICLAIEYLRKFSGIKKAMIVDLDAHQGNGHETDYLGDTDNTFIMDFYNHSIYPGDREAKQAISADYNANMRTTDAEYLLMLKEMLVDSLNKFNPEFLLYNAGTDCLAGDRLGQMNLSKNCIIQRDFIVFEECLKRNIPITMVLSGGYQKINAPIIAESILNLHEKLLDSRNQQPNRINQKPDANYNTFVD